MYQHSFQGMDELPPEILAILEMPGDDSAMVFVGDNEMDMFAGQYPPSPFDIQPTHPPQYTHQPYTPESPAAPRSDFGHSTNSQYNAAPQNFPPPPQQQVQSSTELINHLLQLQLQQDSQLRALREKQTRFFASPSQEAYLAVIKEETELKAQLEQESNHLLMLLQQVLLTPGELHRVDYLRNEFNLQLSQVDLYLHELDILVNRRPMTKPSCSLEIVRQPFPNVPSKQSQLQDDQLVLQLLTGASVKVLQTSPVKATVILETNQGKPTDHKMIDNDTQLLDKTHLLAKFPISFLEGTRKNAAYLRFSVDVQVEQNGQVLSCTLETERNSSPFVVMTNQKQWEACERTLLLKDAYNGQLEITWNYFANAMQRQFIRATKQDPQNPTRCLSRFDFGYLHEKFLGKRTTIHQKEYDNYWNWYGKCVQVIRYQRHISQLWQAGLMYGFMTREEVNMALSGEPPGTFVLRFSERHPGQFGIAYVGSQRDQIKHYLVQPNDTAAAKVTLPDFLRDKPQFIHMLQFTLLPSGTPQFRRLPKDQALQPYYSRRVGGDTSGSGYDPLN